MDETINNYKVTDRNTFIKFLDLLSQDYIKNSNKWENRTLSDFLQALKFYTEDIQGYYNNTNQKIDADKADWAMFADILKGATIYE